MGKIAKTSFKVATSPWRLARKTNIAAADGIIALGGGTGLEGLARSQKAFFKKPSPKSTAKYTRESVSSVKAVAKLAEKFV
jgi:alcohol dehydrogenase class IV